MTALEGKKILFIAPLFFGYENKIIHALESRGGMVLFFPERKYNWIYSLFFKISWKFLLIYQKKYYSDILKKINNNTIDYLFVIRGCQLPEKFIDDLRLISPELKTIMYQWDSEKTNHYIHLRNKFDKLYTFDYEDSDAFKIPYLPLFYTNEIGAIRNEHKKCEFDFLYVGSYRRERYQFLLRLKKMLRKYRFHYYLFIPFRSYCMEYLKGYKIDRSLISFKPLQRAEYVNYLNSSEVVIDLTPSIQSGLPIRVIEALGAGKKVITTNKYACLEFAGSSMIKELDADDSFESCLQNSFCSISNISDYSIDSWIKKIFEWSD